MPKSDLVFGSFNTSTSSGRYYKTQPINFPTPEKDIDTFKVPGRSGALLVDYGSYRNVEIAAEIAIQAKAPQTFLTLYDALKAAMMSQSGYQRLEDSLYSGEYRMARAVGVEMKQTDSMNGTATVTFDAKPQRYFSNGETELFTIEPGAVGALDIQIGIGDDLLSADLITLFHENDKQRTDIYYAVIDVTTYTNPNYDVKLTYGPWSFGIPEKGMTANYFYGRTCNGSPLAGGTPTNIGGVAISQATRTKTVNYLYGFDYIVVPLPMLTELNYNGSVVLSYSPGVGMLAPPDGTISYSPLLHLSVSGAVSKQNAVTINECAIDLNTPATIESEPLTDIYIDCDTYNAYTVINGATYNLNKYVVMDGNFTFSGLIDVSIASDVDRLGITPKWWTI